MQYVHFRTGEEMLVNHLGEYFGTPTLPVYVADPVTSELIGVKGLFVYAMNKKNETTVCIPLGGC